MYLSRLHLDLSRRDARSVLADCRALHRDLLRAFPTLPEDSAARAACGLLFRTDVAPNGRTATVLAQSLTLPDWSRVPKYVADPMKPLGAYWDALLVPGRTLAFRLRANPTKQATERPKDGGPLPPGKRTALLAEKDRIEWLEGKGGAEGERGGFTLATVTVQCRDRAGAITGQAAVPDVRVIPDDWTRWRPRSGSDGDGAQHELVFGAAVFEGRLEVRDPARLRETLVQGVGRGKAFGFGLLSVMPVP